MHTAGSARQLENTLTFNETAPVFLSHGTRPYLHILYLQLTIKLVYTHTHTCTITFPHKCKELQCSGKTTSPWGLGFQLQQLGSLGLMRYASYGHWRSATLWAWEDKVCPSFRGVGRPYGVVRPLYIEQTRVIWGHAPSDQFWCNLSLSTNFLASSASCM